MLLVLTAYSKLAKTLFLQVVQIKTDEKEGYTALQVGGGTKKAKQLTKPLLGHFIAQGANLKRRLHEFRVSSDAVLPVSDFLKSLFLAANIVRLTVHSRNEDCTDWGVS